MVERDIRERYFRLLKGYVVSQDEKYLLEASELGSEMVLAGVPEEEVAETHEEATGRLAQEFLEMTLQDAATSLLIPLIEVIMAYSLAFRIEIEERKWAEEALRESEERYRRIFENIQDVYYEANMDGTILEVSPSIENLSKYKRKELIGKSLYDIYNDPKEREELLSVILAKGKIFNFEVHLTDKDGSQHSVELNTTLDRDQKRNPRKLIGSMRDISERKRLEARLLQSEKMEAVGTLAGGIAHEFNTLMTTVMGNADLALMSTGKDDPLHEGLEDIKSAGERAADLTRQIMAFSRKQMRQPKILDLNEVLVNSEKTLKRLITENIELKTIFEPSLGTVKMDPTQIEQMVVNLVTNARDAMPTGGTLTIETANVDLDEDFFKDLAEKEQPGSYVMLSVTDTGSGMDAKTQEHMFDPFYTTRKLARAQDWACLWCMALSCKMKAL